MLAVGGMCTPSTFELIEKLVKIKNILERRCYHIYIRPDDKTQGVGWPDYSPLAPRLSKFCRRIS